MFKSIKTTGAWILTNGINMGIAQQIGTVVRKCQALEWHDKAGIIDTIHRIAITPWVALSKRNQTELLNVDCNVCYNIVFACLYCLGTAPCQVYC